MTNERAIVDGRIVRISELSGATDQPKVASQ